MKTGYLDSKEREYCLGDIVYNPFFGDLWTVIKFTDEEIEKFDYECPYGLALNNDTDDYVMELTDPEGFYILCSQGEKDYDNYIAEMKKFSKSMKE